MADEVVEKIKNSVDIVEIIGESVQLSKKGRNWGGLCPFHDEKTPSFFVSPERQSWHCFGCGKGGDVISFVMLKEGLSFPETLDLLAQRAGISLPKRHNAPKEEPDLYSLMEQAITIYRQQLKSEAGAVGEAYLKRRNVSQEDAARFELGWAPSSWSFILDRLRQEHIPMDLIQKSGLVVEGDHGTYDRFRGRVIFPIRSVSGRPIAFGGRIVDGEGAKYLNSPETQIYNKKDNLYLLDRAKASIREKNRSILVEGYMDALRLHLCGFPEGIASLGTSLTEEQAILLRRFSDRCYICYDADTAGQMAILRGMYILQHAGLSVFVVQIPQGKDPDDLLQIPDGPQVFEQCLKDALPLVRHHIRLFQADIQQKGEVRAAEDLLNGLSALSAVELAPYMQELGQALAVPVYQLTAELNTRRQRLNLKKNENAKNSFVQTKSKENEPGKEENFHYDFPESAMVYLLWTSRRLRMTQIPAEVISYFSDDRLKSIVIAILSGQEPSVIERQWLEIGDDFPLSVLAAGGIYCETLPGEPEEKWDILRTSALRTKLLVQYNDLRKKMLEGKATTEELYKYEQLAAKLKGGAPHEWKGSDPGTNSGTRETASPARYAPSGDKHR